VVAHLPGVEAGLKPGYQLIGCDLDRRSAGQRGHVDVDHAVHEQSPRGSPILQIRADEQLVRQARISASSCVERTGVSAIAWS